MFITYLVLDPRVPDVEFGHRVVYVGKGREDRPNNIREVLVGRSRGHSGKRFNNWLRKMRTLGYTEVPIIKQPHTSEEAAFAAERELTQRFGLIADGGQLLNGRHGGDGGWSLSEEQRAHLSRINSGSGNSNWGTTWSDERRAKVAATWKSKDRTRSPESMAATWAPTRRRYKITEPSGVEHAVDDLTNWCSQNGHPLSAFRRALKAGGVVASGMRKQSRVNGWKIKYD
jgi:hypothetical protein